MHRDRVGKIDGKAKRTSDVEQVRCLTVSPDYELELYSGHDIGDTGRLDIGVLKPRKQDNPSLPMFKIRWDERKGQIDVDPSNCTEDECRLFRANAPGYSGHHTTTLQKRGRVVEWRLVWKGECLYHGHISCPVVRVSQAPVGLDILLAERRQCGRCGNDFLDVDGQNLCPDCRPSQSQ